MCVRVLLREDDDINDVASMAGVNLREENAQILTTMVGSVVQSCQDQPFLSPNPLLSRILQTGTRSILRQSHKNTALFMYYSYNSILYYKHSVATRQLIKRLKVKCGFILPFNDI